MTRGAVRRGLLGIGAAAMLGLLAAPAAALPRDTPSPTPSASGDEGLPLSITLGRLDPRAPQPGSLLVLAGSVRNIGNRPVRDLVVQLLVSSVPVHTRDELAQLAAQPRGELAGSVRDARTSISAQRLDPGGSASWQVRVGVDDLHLPQPWLVYKMGVEVVGCSDAGCGALGRLRTFLPWAPLGDGAAKPTRIAWVWPLADRPHRGGSTLWQDDALAPQLRRGGRLDGLLRAAAAVRSPAPTPPAPRPKKGTKPRPRIPILGVPVTWAIDPMLLEDTASMAGGYDVLNGDRKPKPGKGQRDAAAWLATLRSTVASEPVVALPYADVDATALVRAGLSDDLRLAMSSGQRLAARLLGTSLLDDVAWPPGGQVDQRTLTVLYGSRIDTVLLGDNALPLLVDPGRTPGARASVRTRDATLTALLADRTLGQIADHGTTAVGGERTAEQRFLAESLMISAEAPSLQRDIVVTPDRRWQPSPTYASALLTDTGRVPWLQPVTLGDVASGQPPSVERGPLTYPDAARAAELAGSYLSGVSAMRSRLDGLASVLPPGDTTVRDLDSGLFRTESAAWRGQERPAIAERNSVAKAIDDARAKVRIASAPGSIVTLTSHSGKVPVTMANDLDAPARVVLRLDAGERLSVAGTGSLVEVLPPHRQVTVEVSARARTAGVFPLTLSLETPQQPTQQLQRVELLVRSTVYGTVALAITGAAAAVLFIAVIARLVRRGFQARHAAEGGA